MEIKRIVHFKCDYKNTMKIKIFSVSCIATCVPVHYYWVGV